jgi:hypothetical protein
MAHAYYLDRYEGDGTSARPFRPSVAAEAIDWAAIDLRPCPTDRSGFALIRVPHRHDRPGRMHLGDDPADRAAAIRQSLNSMLGLSLPNGSFREHVAALLILEGRDDGTRWKPLRPNLRARAYEIWLGGLLGRIRLVAGGSTQTENWNCANSSTSPSCNLTWANIAGTLGIKSNQLYQPTGASIDYARAEADVTTVDHQTDVTAAAIDSSGTFSIWYGGGPCCRFDAAAHTCYLFRVELSDVGRRYLYKVVAGTQTAISSSLNNTNGSEFGVSYGVSAVGSTITGYRGGTAQGNVTDTSISTGTRGGMCVRGDESSSRSYWDNWSCADVAAAGAPPYQPHYQRAPVLAQ